MAARSIQGNLAHCKNTGIAQIVGGGSDEMAMTPTRPNFPLVISAGPLLQPLDIFGRNRILGALGLVHKLPALVIVAHHVDVKIGEGIIRFARASVRSDPECYRLFEVRD